MQTSDEDGAAAGLRRRELVTRGVGRAAAGLAGGAFTAPPAWAGAPSPSRRRARVLVGDVVRYALESEAWDGSFGFVILRLHPAVVNGAPVHYIRTDTSDRAYARAQRLVWAPKLASLVAPAASGALYTVSGGPQDQTTILSSEPGRADYTPAWRIHRFRWTGQPRLLGSADDVQAAQAAGEITVQATDIILNAAVIKWSTGELAVDAKLTEYHGAS